MIVTGCKLIPKTHDFTKEYYNVIEVQKGCIVFKDVNGVEYAMRCDEVYKYFEVLK